MFAKSKEALFDLQKILHCSQCDEHAKELLCLGNCQHWFCRSCAESNAGYQCPKCGIPSAAKKTHVDVQLSNVASLCSQMMELVNSNSCITTSPAKDISRFSNDLEQDSISTIDIENFSNEKSVEKRRKSAGGGIGKWKDDSTGDRTIKKSDSKKDENCPKVRTTGSKNNKATPNQNELVPDAPESGAGKRKARGKCNVPSLPAVTTVPGSAFEFVTPEPRKRKSTKTPTSSGGKRKNPGGIAMTTPDQTITTPKAIKKTPQLSKKASDICNSSLESCSLTVTVRKLTPQSVRKKQAKQDKKNAKGETPLQVATIRMNVGEVKRLLDDGANPNVKDYAGWTPLHEAVGRGKSDIAALLIASGAAVNAPGMDNLTPLHEAVVYQYIDCVQLLIENGADMFCRNAYGYSPIDLAQKDEIKNLLLEASQSRSVKDVDVPLLDESSKPLCFTGSNLNKEQSNLLTKYSRTLQAKVVQKVTPADISSNAFSSAVTHLITSVNEDGSCSRTFKYLSAIVSGKWIVNIKWLETCHTQICRVPEQDFQVPGSTFHPKSGAAHKAVENRLKQLPSLLDGCQIFFYGKFESSRLSKEELASLVTQGGGVVLKREPHLHNLDDYPYTHPYHAQSSLSLADCTIYVIYDDACHNPPSVHASRMACLPVSWLVDSIATFSLLEKSFYDKQYQ